MRKSEVVVGGSGRPKVQLRMSTSDAPEMLIAPTSKSFISRSAIRTRPSRSVLPWTQKCDVRPKQPGPTIATSVGDLGSVVNFILPGGKGVTSSEMSAKKRWRARKFGCIRSVLPLRLIVTRSAPITMRRVWL